MQALSRESSVKPVLVQPPSWAPNPETNETKARRPKHQFYCLNFRVQLLLRKRPCEGTCLHGGEF